MRDEQAWQMLAWQTAHIMNSTGNYREPITAQMLLEPQKPKKQMRQLKREYEQIKKRIRNLKPLPEGMQGMDIYQALGLKKSGDPSDAERIATARADYRSLKKQLGK